MEKLKALFVMVVVVSILVFCAFAPGICIDRFMLPDGCGKGCAAAGSSCCAARTDFDPRIMACR